jgi:hypothetical protein
LAVSNVSPPIKSLKDLLESKDYNLVLKSNGLANKYFKDSPENSTGKFT